MGVERVDPCPLETVPQVGVQVVGKGNARRRPGALQRLRDHALVGLGRLQQVLPGLDLARHRHPGHGRRALP